MTTTTLQRDEWIEQNPLRKWRLKHGHSIMTAAAILGCSTSSIQKWEAGASSPTSVSFDAMEQAIGRDVRSAWKRWTNQQPR